MLPIVFRSSLPVIAAPSSTHNIDSNTNNTLQTILHAWINEPEICPTQKEKRKIAQYRVKSTIDNCKYISFTNNCRLDLSDLELTSFPEKIFPLLPQQINALDMSFNELSGLLDISSPHLEYIKLAGNKLRDFTGNLPKLKKLSIHINQLTTSPTVLCNNLEYLDLSYNLIEYFNIYNFNSLLELRLEHNFIRSFSADIPNMKRLDLQWNGLRSFSLGPIPESLQKQAANSFRSNLISKRSEPEYYKEHLENIYFQPTAEKEKLFAEMPMTSAVKETVRKYKLEKLHLQGNPHLFITDELLELLTQTCTVSL